VEKWKNAMRGSSAAASSSRGRRFVLRAERSSNQTRRAARVRREPAIFLAALSKNFPDSSRAGSARDLACWSQTFYVWRELDVDHASGPGRRLAHALGHERRGVLSLGASLPFPFFYRKISGGGWLRRCSCTAIDSIGFNMMTLMQFGRRWKNYMGRALLFLYVVTGALGFLAARLTGIFP